MRELDELLINVLLEVNLVPKVNYDVTKHRSIKSFKAPYKKGTKTHTNEYGIVSRETEKVLEKAHRLNGAKKAMRTKKAAGPTAKRIRKARFTKSITARQNQYGLK